VVKKSIRWFWKHRRLTIGGLVIVLLILFNVLAYMHAHAMTHFRPTGQRTGSPEALSVWQKAKVLVAGVTIPRPDNYQTPTSIGLPFTVHRFRSVDGTGLESWHIPHSKGRGLVLMFHGYSAAKGSLLPDARALHELGYEVMLVDFRGSGGSDGNVTTIGVQEADDVAAAWEYARSRWPEQPTVLFGHSMGSAAALRAVAVHGVAPCGLVLECPFDNLLHTVGHRFNSMHLPAFPPAHLLVLWGGVQHGFNGFHHNPVDYARSVTCPVLLFHGKNDPRVTSEEVQAIAAALEGRKQLVELEGVSHDGYVTGSPDIWKQAVGAFLRTAMSPP
jgi:alpha-beta hydrolase superfamily lysophospholipase